MQDERIDRVVARLKRRRELSVTATLPFIHETWLDCYSRLERLDPRERREVERRLGVR